MTFDPSSIPIRGNGDLFVVDWVNTIRSQLIDLNSEFLVTKYSLDYTDFSTAGLTNSIELLSLPAKGIIKAGIIKHSTAFSGGSISAYTVSVGITGTLEKHIPAFNVFQSVGGSAFAIYSLFDIESFSAATSIKVTATSVGANLDQATAGAVDIWIGRTTLG